MASESTTARPYARAIFELASERGGYDQWSSRLAYWSAVVQDESIRTRLAEPGVTAQAKADLIAKVSDGLDDDSLSLLKLLAENDRLTALPDMHTQFEQLRRDAEGEVEAHVVSAFALTDEQSARIVEALGKRLSRKVKITSEVDSDLIGGAIIRAGDLVIDGSIRGRLSGLEQSVAR
ncbi:MAG: F0F1 ATP synthase subunit delta [Granulosicoccus sp.]